MIRDALGRNEDILKITLDDISIRNTHGVRFMFKKHEPKLEITFEGPSGASAQEGSQQSYGVSTFGYQPPVPVSVNVHPQSSPARGGDNKWLTVLEKNPFSFGHSGTTINEHLFIFGGFVDEETSNASLLLSDTRGGKFSRLRVRGDIPPVRERHSASLVGKKIYIFGGYCRGSESYYNTVHVFESESLTWTQMEPLGYPPERRCGHSASVVDGKIWIFGGRVKVKKGGLFDTEGAGVQYRNDLHCYDPVTNEWYRYEPRGVGPSGRALHAASVVGRKIYIFGGANSSGSRNDSSGFCDLYELDIDTMTWTECETQNTPPPPCYGRSATYIGDNKILYFGGKGYKVHNHIHILDVKTMSWQQYAYAGNALLPRWGHSATLHDTRVLIYGGRADHGYYNTIESIDVANQLLELKPEEQLKEKVKSKQEERNRTREAIGNLHTTINGLQATLQSLGEQFTSQKKTLNETRNIMLGIRQENEALKQKLNEAKSRKPFEIRNSAPPQEFDKNTTTGSVKFNRTSENKSNFDPETNFPAGMISDGIPFSSPLLN